MASFSHQHLLTKRREIIATGLGMLAVIKSSENQFMNTSFTTIYADHRMMCKSTYLHSETPIMVIGHKLPRIHLLNTLTVGYEVYRKALQTPSI